MINKEVYELEYIRELQKKYSSDPGLIERALYAFGLLEAIKRVGMPFCFKGGTSLMLILDKPARLSTDIDILVEPGTDVDTYIEKAAKIFPFIAKEEDIRKGRNDIVKRHFKLPIIRLSGGRNSTSCWMLSLRTSLTQRLYRKRFATNFF